MEADKNLRKKILEKANSTKEPDVRKYTWETLSTSLKQFWTEYYV